MILAKRRLGTGMMIENRFRKLTIAATMAMIFATEPSFADTSPAEQAAQMLARVQTVDMKCSYLNAADKDVLSNLVARAELALATRESVEATKATLQRGHAAGLAATCNANEKQSVISILGAARQASVPQLSKSTNSMALTAPPVAADVATAPQVAPKVVATPIEKVKLPVQTRIAEPQQPTKPLVPNSKLVQPRQQIAKPAQVAQAPRGKKPAQAVGKSSGLQHYAQMTEAYYLALRCSGGSREVSGLYTSIVAAHSDVMRSHGAKEVSAALNRAKANASGHRCS